MTNPNELLDALYGGSATFADGRPIGNVHSVINRSFADALAQFVKKESPKIVIEIGMAQGASSLSILSTLPANARLISIDPFQHTDYQGIGKSLVDQSSKSSQHELIEKPNFIALPDLLTKGMAADFVYIDGMHTFDYVALDAFYADKLIRPGGVIAFNDCGFR